MNGNTFLGGAMQVRYGRRSFSLRGHMNKAKGFERVGSFVPRNVSILNDAIHNEKHSQRSLHGRFGKIINKKKKKKRTPRN